MIFYINSATKEEIENTNSNSSNSYFYKYVPYKELLKERSKEFLFFKRPELWNDPWESLVLTGNYKIDKGKTRRHPFAGKVLATCFTSNYGSEAQWHIYEQNEPRVMLSFNKAKLIDALKSSDINFYIGKVNYDIDQPKIKKEVEKLAKKHLPIFENPDNIKLDNIEDTKNLLEPLLFKRKAFEYEGEYRIFVIEESGIDKENILIPSLDKAIGKVTLSPTHNISKLLSQEEKDKLWIEYKEKKLKELYLEEQRNEPRKYGFNNINSSSLYEEKVDTLFDITEK